MAAGSCGVWAHSLRFCSSVTAERKQDLACCKAHWLGEHFSPKRGLDVSAGGDILGKAGKKKAKPQPCKPRGLVSFKPQIC